MKVPMGSFMPDRAFVPGSTDAKHNINTVDLPVNVGVITARVGVRVGENLIESVITRQSVEEMNIKVGQQVTAVIKSTEVMLMID